MEYDSRYGSNHCIADYTDDLFSHGDGCKHMQCIHLKKRISQSAAYTSDQSCICHYMQRTKYDAHSQWWHELPVEYNSWHGSDHCVTYYIDDLLCDSDRCKHM